MIFRKSILSSIVAIVMIFLLVGCATIVTEPYETVSINSDPSGAEVVIYNRHDQQVMGGETPMQTQLEKSAGFFSAERYRIEIDKEGYDPVQAQITASPSGWYIGGNLFFGGLIGWLIVDPATGHMWTLTPTEIYESLPEETVEKLDSTGESPHDITVIFRDELPDEVSQLLDEKPSLNLAGR